jgi:hypothetical protein
MDIADKKREILNLLLKLHQKSAQTKHLEHGDRRLEIQQPSTQDPIRKRRQELVDLRSRKERLGQDLLEERLLHIYQLLDDRISRIESIIEKGSLHGGKIKEQASPRGIELASVPAVMAHDPDSPSPDKVEVARSQRPSLAPHHADQLREDPAADLSGQIQEGMIPDIIQLISSNNKSGILKLSSGQRVIELYMHDGDMYHATTEGMEGHDAFFAAIALEDGMFSFIETDDMLEERSIDEDTQFLILEALRQIDEESKGA